MSNVSLGMPSFLLTRTLKKVKHEAHKRIVPLLKSVRVGRTPAGAAIGGATGLVGRTATGFEITSIGRR